VRPIEGVSETDLQYVLDHLSPQNAAEMDALRFDKSVLAKVLMHLARTGYAEIGVDGAEPLVAFGVNASGDFNITWFVATTKFFDLGLAGIRYSRERVKFFRSHLGKPLRSYSYSPLPEAPKWFRALGFEEVESVDGARVFVYN